jgi:hypothetical protein
MAGHCLVKQNNVCLRTCRGSNQRRSNNKKWVQGLIVRKERGADDGGECWGGGGFRG